MLQLGNVELQGFYLWSKFDCVQKKNHNSVVFSPPSAYSLKFSQDSVMDQDPHKTREQSLFLFNSGRDVCLLNMHSDHIWKKDETQL